ncbi:MAG: hypothetical protein GXY36_06275 [Chloroflexi bacterium]|jgi:hypothetical protein|nr:hypothetical protein [Chloroflexota bacterium]
MLEIKELPGEPIIVFHVRLPHVPQDDVSETLKTTAEFKQKMGGHIYRIVDLSLFNLSFSDAMLGMAAERGAEGGVNDMEMSTIFVGSGEMVKFGAKAFQEQKQYGETNVVFVCSTVEEGIAFARAELAKEE